jgi:glycosyltransferase involved in cell wall biosynthesis
MSPRPPIRSVSIYFFAGDFADVLRRHEEGIAQAYGTHTEVAKLIGDLLDQSVDVTVHSFCTPARKIERPRDGLTIKSLGARSYDEDDVLVRAVGEDVSDALIPHFPNIRLMNAVAATRRPRAAFMATSFYRRGPRSWWRRKRTIAALNRGGFDFISNHCVPATEHLADLGVSASKLIPWDVPHPYTPAATSPKASAPQRPFNLLYAGSISEEKGVGDVVRSIRHLKTDLQQSFTFAGNGEIAAMENLARIEGVDSRVNFLGGIPNPDVFRRFCEADLLVVPSRSQFQEGFPLAMFEAIASHTPIVCSDHPIFRRVMEDGRNAMLFRAGDPSDLARVIDRVASNPDLYLGLSRSADETWAKLQGPADWRRLIVEWVNEGPQATWIQQHMLDRLRTGLD